VIADEGRIAMLVNKIASAIVRGRRRREAVRQITFP
jgi:hypothetical protein